MGLWRDPATGKWKYSFQKDGKTYGGGGYESKGEARTAREDRRKLVVSGTGMVRMETPTTHMAFSRLAALYLQQSERRHARKTFRYKRIVFATFLRHCGDEKITVDKITPYLVQDYLHTRKSNPTYNAHRKELAALFEYGRRVLGVVSVNPCAVIEKLPEEKQEKKIPTYDEFIRIVSATTESERPLILILAYTAARIDEVLRLKWEDVNFEHNYIRLWTKKTKDGTYRARTIPIKEYMKSIIFKLWQDRTQDVWVFFNRHSGSRFNRRTRFMRTLCKRAGTPHYGFHSIRHFVSSYLLDQEKVGTPTVSRLLGHQSLSTTDIYAHSIGVRLRDDGLDMAIDRLDASITPKLLPATSSGSGENKQKDKTIDSN